MRRTCLLLGAALALPLVLVGCTRSHGPQTASRALVLIVIDTLRADRLGAMGFAAARTPHLDALAQRGVAFHDAMTPVPVTLPAVTSLLTGLYPPGHGVRDNGRFVLSDEHVTLTERFRAAGFHTAAVVASSVLSADRGLDQGFEHYDDDFAPPYAVYDPGLAHLSDELAQSRRRANTVTDLAIRRLDAFGSNPFFLMVHYFDVHGHYDPPPNYGALHPGRPYDGEISFVDAEIGRLLRHLEKRLDTTIVVVSDHGEGLEEHGEGSHGFLLYQSTLRVPILVSGPGVPAGVVRGDPVSLADLEPTLAHWFGLPDAGKAKPDGRTLRWDQPEEPGTVLYAETLRTLVSYSWSELRAVRQGNFKFIRGAGRGELYDLSADPGERSPLGDGAMTARMAAALEGITEGETRGDVLAALEAPDAQRTRLLESLGYVGGSSTQATPEADLPHPADRLGPWRESQLIRSLVRRGSALVEQLEPAAALALLDSVLAKRPRHMEARYHRALALLQQGDADEFSRQMTSILEEEPEHIPALIQYSSWLLRTGAPQPASDLLRRLVRLDPDNAGVVFNFGVAALELENEHDALAAFERFLDMAAPDDPRADDARGVVRQLKGE